MGEIEKTWLKVESIYNEYLTDLLTLTEYRQKLKTYESLTQIDDYIKFLLLFGVIILLMRKTWGIHIQLMLGIYLMVGINFILYLTNGGYETTQYMQYATKRGKMMTTNANQLKENLTKDSRYTEIIDELSEKDELYINKRINYELRNDFGEKININKK